MSQGGPDENWLSQHADMIIALASNMPQINAMVSAAAYVMGFFYMMKAVLTFKTMTESRSMMSTHSHIREPLMYITVGAMLIYLTTAVQVFLMTTFGTNTILDYNSGQIATIFSTDSELGKAMESIIKTIGLISFIRGWVLMARLGSGQQHQQGGMGKAFLHIFGGIMAMNIVATIDML